MRMTTQQVNEYLAKHSQAINKPTVKPEAEMHQELAEYLRLRGWWFAHSRMDRRTTTAKGVPDFIVAIPGGRTVFVELKRKGGKPTQEQIQTHAHLVKLGHWSLMTDDMIEVIEWLLRAAHLIAPPCALRGDCGEIGG